MRPLRPAGGEWEIWPEAYASGAAGSSGLPEDEDEPLPLYRQWAEDAECRPPAYAPRPEGPPPVSVVCLLSCLLFMMVCCCCCLLVVLVPGFWGVFSWLCFPRLFGPGFWGGLFSAFSASFLDLVVFAAGFGLVLPSPSSSPPPASLPQSDIGN